MLTAFGKAQAELTNEPPEKTIAAVITLDELKAHIAGRAYADAVLALCEETDTRFRSATEVYADATFSIISALDVADVTRNRDRAGILIEKNRFLIVSIVDADASIEKTLLETAGAVGETPSLERAVTGFFERLVSRDNGVLEDMAARIDRMEEAVEKGSTKAAFNAEILAFRRKLTTVRSYYEQLVDFAETMQENENGLFTEKNLRYFSNMISRMERLSNSVQQLRDALIQVREAYQAQLEFKQNEIMKLFTVVTTIFLPLTLLAGWYGMNFHYMPELSWRYGYVAVIAASVAIVLGGVWIFKKKKWM